MAALKQIGDIQIFAEIYQGATTFVYKGFQPVLDRFVFLKVLRPEFSQDENLSRSFEEEAKFIAKIQHPNVVTIFDSGRFEKWLYFAAEFVEGYNLSELLRFKKLPPELAYFILLESTKGLKAAHDKNILHKDIKPSNILISHDGQVKITDFGMADLRLAAKSETEYEVKGTLAYFSPEQILGEQLNKYSDIFALGATFYEILAGAPAFSGNSTSEYFDSILNDTPTQFLTHQVLVPAELRRICQKMLMKKPTQRYQDCDALLQDLTNFQVNHEITVGATDLKAFTKAPDSYSAKSLTPVSEKKKIDTKLNYKYALSFAILVVLIFLFVYYFSFSGKQKDVRQASNFMNLQSDSLKARSSSKESPLNIEETAAETKITENIAMKVASDHLQQEVPKDTAINQIKVNSESTAIASGEVIEEDRVPDLPNMGYVQISCVPWAIVYSDGDSMGTTPLKDSLQLAAGWHEITFKNPDFPEYKMSLEIKKETLSRAEFSLWLLVGTLNLEVSPWAEILIDGEYRDTVPPQRHPFILFPGKHTLTLKHPRLGTWQREIEVKAGESLDLQLNLRDLLAQ